MAITKGEKEKLQSYGKRAKELTKKTRKLARDVAKELKHQMRRS